MSQCDPRGLVCGPCPACGSPQYDDAYWRIQDRYDSRDDTVPAAHHEELRQVMLAERRRAESAESEIARLVLAALLDEDLEVAAHEEAARLTERAERAERERDELRAECAQMSAEFGLPPTIRPAEGEIARFMAERKQAMQERDEARALASRRLLRHDWVAASLEAERDATAVERDEAYVRVAEEHNRAACTNDARISALTTLRRLYQATEDECGGFFLSDPGPWGEARDEALRVLTTATREVGDG